MARVKYETIKETPLKWHRVMQVIGYPITILVNAYLLIGLFLELLQVTNTPFLKLATWFSLMETPAIMALLVIYFVVQCYVAIKAWTGSFKWKKSSLRLTLLHFILLVAFASLCIFYIYTNSLHVLIGMNLHAYANRNIGSRVVLLLIILVYIAVLMYAVMSFSYYVSRRKLYHKPVSSRNSKTEEKMETVEEEHSIPEKSEENEKVEPVEIVEPEVVVQEVEEVPAIEMTSEKVSEPEVVEAVSDSQIEDNLQEDVVSEEEPVQDIVENNDAESDSETISLAEGDEEIVIKDRKEILFCSNCGVKLKPDSIYCSNCGQLIK